ncbi:MAG: pirin family protein [Saprospiraceae bacterium]|nr:pirin family protein [Saprospiraceae bacterium]
MNKAIQSVIPATNLNMEGVIVKQTIPTDDIKQVDPFLLLHHGKFKFREQALARQQGIGPHPHRGFSPVTFVVEGEVHHRDSRGNDQIAKEGEVQWMHSGAGIIHSERPSSELVKRNGVQEIVQLWINSPSGKKMQVPSYQFLAKAEIPVFFSEDEQITNKLIAGTYSGLHGKIKTESDLLIIWGISNSDGSQTIIIPPEFNCMLYVVAGSLRLPDQGQVFKQNLIVFDRNEATIEISCESKSQFLLLAGKPIDEKIVRQGPFVMNTETQILEAMRDYRMGKMGVLIEEN